MAIVWGVPNFRVFTVVLLTSFDLSVRRIDGLVIGF